MPQLLDTPLVFPAVHGVAGATYSHVKVVGFSWDINAGTTTIVVEYGAYDAGSKVWTPGDVPANTLVLEDVPDQIGPGGAAVPANPECADFMTTNSATFDSLITAVYAHLESVRGLYPGTEEA